MAAIGDTSTSGRPEGGSQLPPQDNPARDALVPVQVRFFGVVRGIVSEPTAELTLPSESRLRHLVAALLNHYGPAFGERLLTADGCFESYVRIFVDDQPVACDDVEAPLGLAQQPGSRVTIYVVPAPTGGV